MENAGKRSLIISRTTVLAVLAVGAIALFSGAHANAQDATLPTKEVNITLNQAPVRTALDTLFKSVGLNYTIDPSVTGLVTVSLRAIPFDVALRSILRSSEPPLAFTEEDSIYNIHPREQTIDINPTGTPEAGGTVDTTPVAVPDTSTVSQVVPISLEYIDAYRLLTSVFSGGPSGVIQTLSATQASGGTGGAAGGAGGFGGGGAGGIGGGGAGGFGGGGSSFGGGGSSFGGGGSSFGGGGSSFGGGGRSY